MKETIDLIQAWRSLPPGSSAVLATVVETFGSTYRRASARMLISESGWVAGSISGGCLESDLVTSAWERTADGPALVTYDATSDDDIVWGFGLGCNGMVRVLLERVDESCRFFLELERVVQTRKPTVVATVIGEGDDLGRRWFLGDSDFPIELRSQADSLLGKEIVDASTISNQQSTINNQQFLAEALHPPRPLVVFGAGHDAISLVAAAKLLGWHVTVTDARPTFAKAERFPLADVVLAERAEDAAAQIPLDSRTAAVLMTHHYPTDLEALRLLLSTEVSYIGLLGPRRRSDRMLAELGVSGDPRIHAPIGLDIGAEGPEQIALAIVAEIQAFFAGKSGGFLTEATTSLLIVDC